MLLSDLIDALQELEDEFGEHDIEFQINNRRYNINMSLEYNLDGETIILDLELTPEEYCKIQDSMKAIKLITKENLNVKESLDNSSV